MKQKACSVYNETSRRNSLKNDEKLLILFDLFYLFILNH